MERSDKVFMALSFAALIVVLMWEHRRASVGPVPEVELIPSSGLDLSKRPDGAMPGPSYLLSALPSVRMVDDFLPNVSAGLPGYTGPDNYGDEP